MTIDLNQPWCVYRTTHPTGFYYEGKGRTTKVETGAYQGSGIRFKLALLSPGFETHTWTTTIINTYSTEEAAFEGEASLVSLESLGDPYRLNMHAGGANGKYQTHGRLLSRIASAKRRQAAELKKAKAKANADKAKQYLKELKKELKDKQ
jgi:hypothetical protein